MKNIIRNFLKIIFPDYFEKKRVAVLSCVKEKNVVIYKTASITNLTGDKNNIYLGEGSHIAGVLTLFQNCGKIFIGKYSFVGDETRIFSAKEVIIGNRVQIAHGCNIFDNNIHSLIPAERHQEFLIYTQQGTIKTFDLKENAVNIQDDVWIGACCIIMKGVTIGKNSIIGAGSVVVNNIPENVVAAGNPARVVKELKNENNA